MIAFFCALPYNPDIENRGIMVSSMRNHLVKKIALGGMLAAVAVVIMCLGGMIPLATFICPMLCMLIEYMVWRFCGNKIALAWFASVALLSILVGSDKEAALVFCLIGYYPVLKPWLEKSRLHWLWKALIFNGIIALIYGFLLRILGLDTVAQEYEMLGIAGAVICLLLGNVTFFLFDRLLSILSKRKFGKKS